MHLFKLYLLGTVVEGSNHVPEGSTDIALHTSPLDDNRMFERLQWLHSQHTSNICAHQDVGVSRFPCILRVLLLVGVKATNFSVSHVHWGVHTSTPPEFYCNATLLPVLSNDIHDHAQGKPLLVTTSLKFPPTSPLSTSA